MQAMTSNRGEAEDVPHLLTETASAYIYSPAGLRCSVGIMKANRTRCGVGQNRSERNHAAKGFLPPSASQFTQLVV